ncbi:MAG: thiamine phosphate synthase [Gammaproteobacteria bacterium]|nr:thiamine phosphate synthase [Gammaproteobacteria bacterium]MBU6510433.1 thiamine phosphate synthase [Gammaproteobacteria bacterium]MDE1984017.1 thiamine phosphate synthase [Gammaproteobacteria bacterium]MDE2108543.1 thiamine phosphate synthase [Gammaproteobacteria bacterium]MDE2460479.1 thiamine phosphate synthase [Gammaproteobacteria bacterium]
MNIASHGLHGLYALTDSGLTAGRPLSDAVAAAIRGGTRLVQYRDKSADHARRTREAQVLLAVCREYEVPFIVNDDVALAGEIGADGVHLGREDAALEEARVQLGPRALIGVSCYASLERAIAAEHAGADYVAFGSFFASPSKPQAVHAPQSLLTEARQRLNVPICAIGGITPANGAELLTAGADMLAVISGLFAQTDIEAAARCYARLFQ